MPRTSFVIPARNAGATLARALDSVLAQTDGDWEALVIDDASSDDTPAVLAQYAQRDARIVALRGNGRDGAAGARNLALGQSRGARIVFLDADDWHEPTFLATMQRALDAVPGAAAAYCDHRRVMPDGAQSPVYSLPHVARAPLDAFVRNCPVAIHGVLVECAALQCAGAFDTTLRSCEDWDLWQRVARGGGAWVHVPQPLAFYRTHAHSLSQRATQGLADAAVVIARGFGPDARVAAGAEHAAGASRQGGASPELHLAYVALWYHAMAAAQGDAEPLTGALRALPPDRAAVPAIVGVLLDGLMVGTCTPPEQLAAQWMRCAGRMGILFGRLGALWQDAVATRRLQYAFERALLRCDGAVAEPRVVGSTLGVRIDLRRPHDVALPDGIDQVCAHLCDGDCRLLIAETGALGTLGSRRWLRLGAAALSTQALARAAAPALARTLSLRPWRDAVRALRNPSRGGWRPRARAAARAAVSAALAAQPGEDGHAVALEALRADASAHAPPAAADGRVVQRRPSHALAPSDRRAYWEALFEQPDPWNYGSDYEQEKYALQLELLPARPIERALELACAEGRFTQQLAPHVRRLLAADISATALARAAARCAGAAQVEFRQLDLVADDLPPGQDLVLCSEVLYYLDSEAELQRVAERLARALAPGGCVITAHALLLVDDRSRTGFDWGHRFGGHRIAEAFAATPGLQLERSIVTPLYRVDRFVRRDDPIVPTLQERALTAQVEPKVARRIVWGGTVALRSEVATERRDRLPVLAYHRIADDGPPALARWRVRRTDFERQLGWLRRHGYHTIVAEELAWFIANSHPFVGRPVVLSFDDGYRDFEDTAWPLLERHDFRADVFVVTDLAGTCAEWDRAAGEPAALMDESAIARLAHRGVSFGSHLATHRSAEGLSTRELACELLRSRAAIERWAGRAPCALAAPFGDSDERLRRLAAECGYRVGLGTEPGAASLTHDAMQLPRIEVRGDMTLEEFAATLEGVR